MKFCPKCGAEINGGKFCSNCGYNTQKTAKEKKPAPAFIQKTGAYVKAHKGAVIGGSIGAIALLTAVIVLIVVLSSIFRIGKVSKIELGMSEEQVVEILGEANEQDGNEWIYFEKKFAKKYEKMEALGERLFEVEKESELEDIEEEIEKLTEKLEEMEFKCITVSFTAGEVSGVFYEPNCQWSLWNGFMMNEEKEVRKVKILMVISFLSNKEMV